MELLEKGETTAGFVEFYRSYLIGSADYSIILPTWNHLWYVAYLLVYTCILIALYPLVNQLSQRAKAGTFSPLNSRTTVAILPVLIFALHELWLEDILPSTHALVDDWGNHALYFPFLFFAFVAAKSEHVWHTIDRLFKTACFTVLILGAWQLFVWSLDGADIQDVPFIEVIAIAHMMVVPIYAWACIIAAFGLVRRYANKPSRVLSYMTEAIFPWYILHQTFIIVVGFWLTRQGLSSGLEFALLTFATFAGCLFVHEYIIRRSPVLRPLFGLKSKASVPADQRAKSAFSFRETSNAWLKR
ncbi:MAG: acyltransferase family protein [Pseudomonadota bacterium]